MALIMPGTLPEVAIGSSEIRTIHFSLRAHRDNLLKHLWAAHEALGDSTVNGFKVKDELSLLGE